MRRGKRRKCGFEVSQICFAARAETGTVTRMKRSLRSVFVLGFAVASGFLAYPPGFAKPLIPPEPNSEPGHFCP